MFRTFGFPFQAARRVHGRRDVDDLFRIDGALAVGKRKHRDIAVVVPFLVHLRSRQDVIEGCFRTAFGLAPDEFLHRKLRSDPRSAGGRVARAELEPEVEIAVGGLLEREVHVFPPCRRKHRDEWRARHGFAHAGAAGAVGNHRAAEADVLHRIEVGHHALAGGVVVHEPPPEDRVGFLGRRLEGIGEGLDFSGMGASAPSAEGEKNGKPVVWFHGFWMYGERLRIRA